MTKKQPQEHLDLKSTTDSTRNRTENKKCGEHEQIQIEIPLKGKIGKSREERTKQEMTNKTNVRTIVEHK